MVIISSLFFLSGCSDHVGVIESLAKQGNNEHLEIVCFWYDKETSTVHKIASENGKERVVSVIKYRNGRFLEKMKIISSSCLEGKTQWIYFVPSTKYVVEMNAVLKGGSSTALDWKNQTAEGEIKSGSDQLVRCDETGAILSEEKNNGMNLPDNFFPQ